MLQSHEAYLGQRQQTMPFSSCEWRMLGQWAGQQVPLLTVEQYALETYSVGHGLWLQLPQTEQHKHSKDLTRSHTQCDRLRAPREI